MNCRELIGVMAAKGYWKSAGGRTPWASLHAGIMKEIAAQGRRARFRKVGRGQFARREAGAGGTGAVGGGGRVRVRWRGVSEELLVGGVLRCAALGGGR